MILSAVSARVRSAAGHVRPPPIPRGRTPDTDTGATASPSKIKPCPCGEVDRRAHRSVSPGVNGTLAASSSIRRTFGARFDRRQLSGQPSWDAQAYVAQRLSAASRNVLTALTTGDALRLRESALEAQKAARWLACTVGPTAPGRGTGRAS